MNALYQQLRQAGLNPRMVSGEVQVQSSKTAANCIRSAGYTLTTDNYFTTGGNLWISVSHDATVVVRRR